MQVDTLSALTGERSGRCPDRDDLLDALTLLPPGADLARLIERLVAPGTHLHRPPVPRGEIQAQDEAGTHSLSGLLPLAVLAPGEVSAMTEDLASLGLEALIELVAACARLTAWASFTQALTCAALARHPDLARPPVAPDGRQGPLPPQDEVQRNTASEIACRLGISRARATTLLTTGQDLAAAHMAPTAALARTGLLDHAKTSILVRRLADVDEETAAQVQQHVLPRAPHRTHSQLVHDIDAALTALDPEGINLRRRRSTAARHVTRPRPKGEGVHEMRMLLPSPDAFLIDATLDAVAGAARATGDGRTLSQLRADTLVAMSLRTLSTALHQACAAADTTCSTSTVDGADIAGSTDPTGRAPEPGRLLPDGVPLEPLLACLSQLVGSTSPWWTPSGSPPVSLPPGLQVHVDVTVPIDHLLVAAFTSVHDVSPDTVSTASPGTVDDAHAGAEATALLSSSIAAGGRSTPVPAVLAATLAAGGTWRRLLTDPATGTVVDVGRTRYRPPAALAQAVRSRDLTCTHPGCQVPAHRCDIDHIQPWSEGGTTSLDNLTLLCEAHHRLKHTPGWSLTRADDGALEWHTPSRTRYRRTPDGTITMLPRRVGPRQLWVPASPLPHDLCQAVTDAVVEQLARGLRQAQRRTSRSKADMHSSSVRPSDSLTTSTRPVPTARTTRPTPPRQPRLESRGPRPGEKAGAWQTTPVPPELHALGLAPLLDKVIPF